MKNLNKQIIVIAVVIVVSIATLLGIVIAGRAIFELIALHPFICATIALIPFVYIVLFLRGQSFETFKKSPAKAIIKEWRTLVNFLCLLILGAIITRALVLIILASVAFVTQYWIWFLFSGGGLLSLVLYIIKNMPQKQSSPLFDEKERQMAQHTYESIGKAIFSVFQKMSEVHAFIRPAKITDIFSPEKYYKQNGKWYHLYVAVKSDHVDAMAAERFFRDELERMLLAGDANGLPESTRMIDELKRPLLDVYSVIDAGTYIKITIVVVTENYVRERNIAMNQAFEARTKEEDANDDEFI